MSVNKFSIDFNQQEVEDRIRLAQRKAASRGDTDNTYITITSADSPYNAEDGQRITADMSSGSIVVVQPVSGNYSVSRKGSLNTLTIQGTVNGVLNPEIKYDGSAPTIAIIGGEGRYI